MAWGMLAVAAYGAYNKSKAGEEGKALSAENEAAIYAENTEAIRKTKLTQSQTLSEAKATSGAGGLSMKSATVMTYLDEMKATFKKDIDWMEESRTRGMKIERQRGENIERQGRAGAIGSLAGGIASVVDDRNK